MGLVSQSTKNLKGGISQQPDILRFAEQGSEQINGWSSETEGLQKRPPTIFKKRLGDRNVLNGSPLIHLINRDENEQYYVVFTGTGIKVFDLEGKEYAVKGNMDYVKHGSPRDYLRMVTVADYTFIVNKAAVVRNRADKSTGGTFNPKRDCLIAVRGSQYGRTIKVTINGVDRVNFTLHDGAEAWQGRTISTDKVIRYIVDQLKTGQTTKGEGNLPGLGHYGVFDYVQTTPLPSTWTVQAMDGFVYVSAPSGQQIDTITTSDGYSDQLVYPVTHYAQTTTKLPLTAPDGYYVKIVGEAESTADQYYLQFDKTSKVWKESVGWNTTLGFNRSTMPHALVRQADGSFELKALDWRDRTAGDEETNPDVSLVGGSISDVFFYRNRLGFLSGENIVLSRTGKYFNLYPASVASLSDDDPIDVAVSHNRISTLKYAVPFSEELLLWSDQAQFVLTAAGVLSSKTIELNMTTEFDVSDRARPYGIGRGIYFASPRASYTGLMRYYAVQETMAVKSAEDMSAHVPNYVPNGVYSIKGSGTENFVSILTTGSPNKIYFYKFLYIDEEIVQQAWSHWDFGSNVEIMACDSIGSVMHIIARNSTDTFLVRVNFTKNTQDFVAEPYRLYIDHKLPYTIPTSAFNEDEYITKVDFRAAYGMSFQHGDVYVVAKDGVVVKEEEPEGGWKGNPVVNLTGDWRNQEVFIGFAINFRYVFSKFLIKKSAEDGSTATEDIGRLQLRRAWVNYENSGAFLIEVENSSRLFKYTMSGARLGSSALRAGRLNVGTGQYRYPVTGNAVLNEVRIISDHTTPLNVIGCGWEGNYIRRSSGI